MHFATEQGMTAVYLVFEYLPGTPDINWSVLAYASSSDDVCPRAPSPQLAR